MVGGPVSKQLNFYTEQSAAGIASDRFSDAV
jgi:hypothetical protein